MQFNQNYMELLNDPDGHNMNVMAERLLHVINKLDVENIKTVLDIGSMDAWESINLARVFHDANVYTFEPVRANFELCQHHVTNVKNPSVKNRINLQNYALNDVTGPMQFWELDTDAARLRGKLNHGIASKFQLIDPDMWPWEHNVQRAVTVTGYRLDDWCADYNIERVDAIWMDAQGAELDILKGAGDVLKNVQVIMTEAGLKPYYHGHTMKVDIDAYLATYGFAEWRPATRQAHEYEADVIYLNTNLTRS